MLKVTVLESVGSCIDDDCIVYPMNVDGTPDINCGGPLVDCSDEWYSGLSNDDVKLVVDVVMKKVLVS